MPSDFQRLGARPDERDSEGFTPFHRAFENGDKRMLDYFFETFPPLDCDGQENPVNMKIYNPVDRNDMSTSLVFLATLSGDAEVVDYVLDKASIREVKYAWRFVQSQLRKCRYHKMPSDDWEEVLQMLEQKEGFVPPVVEQGRRQYGQPRQL